MASIPPVTLTVNLPDIGEGVTDGEVIAWLKREGDPIKQDEPVVVVMTDKATVELPAPQPGKLGKTYISVGEMAQKDKPLYDLEIEASVQISKTPEKVTQETEIQRHRAENVELSQKCPQFSYCEYADASRLVKMRQKMGDEGQKAGLNLTFMPFYIRALSLLIHRYPLINSSYDHHKGEVIMHKPHHVGLALPTERGLRVPVLKNVQDYSLIDLIYAYEDLKKAQWSPSDMTGSTITLTHFGGLKGKAIMATPLIHYPQSANLGISPVSPQPMVVNQAVEVRERVTLCFTFDHRLIDEQMAAEISSAFVQLIENPAQLI